MTKPVTIALDAMGGDIGCDVVVPAAAHTINTHPDINIILVGDTAVVQPVLDRQAGVDSTRLRVQHASQRVEMDELPSSAMRNKKDSSMRVALNLVKSGAADACVSAGNTGALMATARYVLKTLPGIDRPAIISAVPGLKGPTYMLDIGANVGCTPEQLVQFAVMGSVVASDMLDIEQPRVGLLNIGQEDIKGNEIVREAGALIAKSGLNYKGFIEGNGIFEADIDVVVSDGFVGNVAIKTMEGVGSLFGAILRQEFKRNAMRRIQALAANSALNALRARFDPRRYNGASFVGLNGIVVKSHGGADKVAFENAVQTAIVEARKGMTMQIGELVESQPAVECIRA
jgi:glycerol-3-phosphate acyltransferase PlsX